MHVSARVLVTACAAVLLAGCAGSPPVKFYTLAALDRATGATTVGGLRPIYVAAVTTPGYLERSAIVVRRDPYVISFSDFQRWAAPLEEEIARTMSENLAARFGSAVDPDTACKLRVDIVQFEPTTHGQVELIARWILRNAKHEIGAANSQATRYTAQAEDETYEASAAAMSRTLAELCNEIAAAYEQTE